MRFVLAAYLLGVASLLTSCERPSGDNLNYGFMGQKNNPEAEQQRIQEKIAADYNNYEEMRQLAATLANHPYLKFTFEVETLERPKIYIQFWRPVRTEMANFLPIQVEKLPLEDAEKPTKAQLKQ